MYCEYWNLNKPPFDNVPDPSMYVDCHVSMENVISETIFAIKEANECFAVIIGDIGLGKTLSLRIIIDSLEPHKYKIALITNPSISFVQLLREIIGQISGKQCTENIKVDLLEIFNHLLFEVLDQGMKIVIFIDEANAISPANLENLRLLTNMQDDKCNLFTLVLAGQMELARRLEHPKRANLFQRIGTYGRIDKLPSEDTVKTYIETRLKLAGAQRKFFADDCIPVIWESSDHGVPRLINKICKLCLKAGETNEFRIITSEAVTQIAERFQKLSQVALQKRKPRSRPDLEFTEEEISMLEEMEDSQDISKTISVQETELKSPIATVKVQEIQKTITPQETATQVPTPVEDLKDLPKVISQQKAEPAATQPAVSETPSVDNFSALREIKPVIHQEQRVAIPISESVKVEASVTEINSLSDYIPKQSEINDISVNEGTPSQTQEEFDEILIGDHRIRLTIPKNIMKRVKSLNSANANKSAGFWAAQIIKNNPQLTHSPSVDPVALWNEIKSTILKKITV